MSEQEIKDITIIGAGPAGLFTALQAGMHDASIRIIDSISEPGGQLAALYPEKYIYDVPGFPRVTAKDLATNLFEQANQFSPELRLNETALDIETPYLKREEGGLFNVITDKGCYPTRVVIIAAGFGAFSPRTLDIPGIEQFEDSGVYYFVREKESFRNKDVVIVGGGDSALDWALNLIDIAGEVSLIHRRDTFRAHPNTIQQVFDNVKKRRIKLFTPYEVKGLYGDTELKEIVISGSDAKEESIRADALLLLLGFTSDLGPIEKWGLEIEDNRVKVDVNMETSRNGIFAVGDIANYPGKLKLILTGFSDAAQAVRNSVSYIRHGDKVRHAHSTSLKMFSQKL